MPMLLSTSLIMTRARMWWSESDAMLRCKELTEHHIEEKTLQHCNTTLYCTVVFFSQGYGHAMCLTSHCIFAYNKLSVLLTCCWKVFLVRISRGTGTQRSLFMYERVYAGHSWYGFTCCKSSCADHAMLLSHPSSLSAEPFLQWLPNFDSSKAVISVPHDFCPSTSLLVTKSSF